MIIGIDFDNTIVSYDALFHRIAGERGLLPPELAPTKTAVRNHLRATGREDLWTELQGLVYGARLAEAEPYAGVLDFFRACRQRGVAVRIISHKTRQPYRGEPHDLHAAARAWLGQHGFFDPVNIGLREEDAIFEATKDGKLRRIAACGCTHFIDDLPELLAEPAFPQNVARFLFDPQHAHPMVAGIERAADWATLQKTLLGPEPWSIALAGICTRRGLTPTGAPGHALPGGANNRVFRLPLAGGQSALVKRYFQHPNDARDRFAAERSFYAYAAAAGLRQVPQALGWDETERVGVLSFIEGSAPAAAGPAQVDAALHFFADLNRARHQPEARALPAASEACFSLDSHLRAVEQRVAQLEALPLEDALDAEAAAFVHEALLPAWEAVSAAVRTRYFIPERTRVLPPRERCLSPSDFGFHNSLVAPDGRMVFFDFEYAGWDDPAKLVGDFFCQPDVPVPAHYFERFVTAVAAGLGLPDPAAFAERSRALLPVYQVKWSGILLNDFTRTGRDRRAFSLGATAAGGRRARQLARARVALAGLLQTA